MSQDSGDINDSQSNNAESKRPRRVAKTMLDVNSPELKKIQKLLQAESQQCESQQSERKVAKTNLEIPIPQLTEDEPASPSVTADAVNLHARKIAKTLADAPLPPKIDIEKRVSKTLLDMPIPSVDARVNRQHFVAKTRLDHEVLSITLRKYEDRKEQIAIEEARERANQPFVELVSVDSKKLVRGCPWVWAEGNVDDKFRYCGKCKTPVYNFDGMELPEAEALIFTRENKKSPTLYKRDDGKFMTQDCPVQVNKRQRLIFVSVVVATLIVSSIVMLILAPPQPSAQIRDEQAMETGDGISDSGSGKAFDRRAGKAKSGKSGAPLDGSETGSTTGSDVYIIDASGKSKRKRPVFGPEDENQYWE